MRITGTTLALACAALAASWSMVAAAQDEGGAPDAAGVADPAPDGGGGDEEPGGEEPGGEERGEDEPAPPEGEVPPGQVSVAATTSVVVDEREADLAREQAEMRESPDERAVTDDPNSLDHEFQLGLRFGVGVPFLFALRYGMGPQCDDRGEQFCLLVGSGIMDLDLSFGVTPDLEITLMGRYGMVGVEPTENNNIVLGLGIRSYVSPESVFKGFFGVRAILDLTPAGAVSGWSDVDAGVRGEAGIQVDFVRYFGLYAQIGVNITFVRALAIAPDVTGGLQLRVP